MSEKTIERDPHLRSNIRVADFETEGLLGKILKVLAPPLEWLLGISDIRKYYEENDFAGREKFDFLRHFIDTFKVRYHIDPEQLTRIPREGPLVIVANHPLGGLEGIILPYLLKDIRPDLKILVNFSLMVFKELKDFYIYINNIVPNHKWNYRAIMDCQKWIKNGNCLMLFPAGWVGYYRKDKGYVTDAEWSRIAVNMAHKGKANVIPIYVEGEHSTLFNWLSRAFYYANPLLLARELFYSVKKPLHFQIGRAIRYEEFKDMPYQQASKYLRMRTYLLKGQKWAGNRDKMEKKRFIRPLSSTGDVTGEVESLPDSQILITGRGYTVYCTDYTQSPLIVQEICSRRQTAFDSENTSGQPDEVDKRYTHIFLWWGNEIAGGCRIGPLEKSTFPELDLKAHAEELRILTGNKMRGMELGGQFLVPAHQETASGLVLMTKGITRYLKSRESDFSYLLGIVPLIKPYMEASTALLIYTLLGKKSKNGSWLDFDKLLHREVEDYLDEHSLDTHRLDRAMHALEGFNIPPLIKLHKKIGARFLTMTEDVNGLRGLLYILTMDKIPEKHRKKYR